MLATLTSHLREKYHPLWRLRQIPAFRRLQKALDFTTYTAIPGTNLKVAVRFIRDSSWIWAPQALEPEIRLAFEHVLAGLKPRIFWDIGANIGLYSWLVRQAGSIDQVVMFEPDPTNYALISRTLKRNAISDCVAMNVAMADHDGQASFLVDPASGATGTLGGTATDGISVTLHQAYGMRETISCRTVTMDKLVAEGLAAPDFIKVDVEGAESLVLAGGQKFLRERHPALIIEAGSDEVIKSLEEIGYAAMQIDHGNWLFIESGQESDVFTALKHALEARSVSVLQA
ncbi:FkbM family methyltransferase [Roseimicrobium sp. ORNL1]|uniref:FkbM family methyltransferase n=1 Tax=Roseimicrobium sp. ORNL1 TaxID=2711231 RepID=UPI0013E144E9|nr:FkbM family methyltransferase [Roseimicrobium sp. ORNL1]QIF01885.1 FkbM family methyltransferase [Roseimicrobium sp. ORNL1]